MKVLIACEESQAVCIAFRERGHEAYSCDILPCSGFHPEWHIKRDIFEAIEPGQKWFENGDRKYIPYWDMMIAFPPCTHLSVSGARWFEQKRKDGRQHEAVSFFMDLIYADIDRIAIENPVGIMSSIYRKPDCIIQPWMFGHGETKATCLWLKNLPLLKPTDIVEGREGRVWRMPPSKDRAMLRSKTFHGIAAAMAEQWG